MNSMQLKRIKNRQADIVKPLWSRRYPAKGKVDANFINVCEFGNCLHHTKEILYRHHRKTRGSLVGCKHFTKVVRKNDNDCENDTMERKFHSAS